jgi:hypothetical protein
MKLYKEIGKLFPQLEKFFTDKELIEFINESDLDLYHFGFGTWIRNNFIHPDKSVLRRLFLENYIVHPDDMSSLIIKLFHEYLSKNSTR